ncbi:MAG: PepSY-like domain-containing protein [Bacteroidetes bacterium]|nr:PepSY-like domain-containing protein [Bacteroidota bacterium]
MKKIIILAFVLIGISSIGFAQDTVPKPIIPPKAVRKTFKERFPDAKSVRWEKEDAREYEASFRNKTTKKSATFSNKGELLETETRIPFLDLPEKVQKAYFAKHSKSKPTRITKIETSRGVITYELEMKRGENIVEVFYSPEGAEIPFHK